MIVHLGSLRRYNIPGHIIYIYITAVSFTGLYTRPYIIYIYITAVHSLWFIHPAIYNIYIYYCCLIHCGLYWIDWEQRMLDGPLKPTNQECDDL
ncbi:hypothetical protein SKAU_G00375970 [Synaphobranchus kaupii]|uniref:Uncharacterized protein n=1 Tax=Synaphobranchus kaupii TaxID=118154 RepID=A0A9Q1IE61_SYNKA|nr:hypothetical protein SKAU_G00375970 [Synaphobranchus kaupii]